MSWLAQSAALVFALTLAGGLLPLALRRTDRVQHLMIAFAAGVFLGVVFLHLLPEVALMAEAAGSRGVFVWGIVLAGVVLLFLVENLLLRSAAPGSSSESQDADTDLENRTRHQTVGYATFFGLSVHAFTAGLGLSAGADVEELRSPLFLSVVTHKAVEGFSLCAALLLAETARRKALVAVVLFSLITPLAALGRALLVPGLDGLPLQLLTAAAAGTFLFVALCDLLPEVFHHRHDTGAKIGLLAAGVGVSVGLHSLAG